MNVSMFDEVFVRHRTKRENMNGEEIDDYLTINVSGASQNLHFRETSWLSMWQ